ncbi:cytochrome P450 [Mycobacterium sp. WUMAC-067]|uniref:cytochrome P450 n=1 Tax=unclassified Mycobacterium TaxID=2642494 RepID=UPI001CDA152C|nr:MULTISPECIES: cytochrome P450 [unclassified Mycobacterium]MCA2245456.1 cytochrome P450 [Mycobacterium sp. WUMAC-067]MCA2316986.1 cytochrome P450 [Mycobacterium sp. WUMAC-025]
MSTKAPADGDADPFALPDPMQIGPSVDPYPYVAEARRRNAVQQGWPLPTATSIGPAADVTSNAYNVLGYEEVAAVFRDDVTYSSSLIAKAIGPLLANTIVAMDEPEHHTHRSLVFQAFRPKLLARWETELVRPAADELIDSFAGLGRADLVRRFTFALPIRVIARILGLPRHDIGRFQRWSIEVISIGTDWDRGMAAFDALRDYFAELVEQRRRDPQDDLITELVGAEVDGQRLSDEEIFAFLRLLLPAGVETTYRSLGNLLFALLTHPDQLAEVIDDPGLIPQAVEEGLRWLSPIFHTGRVITRDGRLGGVDIPAGSTVTLFVGAANRDEKVFTDADSFDVHRKHNPHLAFAVGAHSCLGMHLARMENRISLQAILERLPELRLDPDAAAPQIIGMPLRSPEALPVLFTAATS